MLLFVCALSSVQLQCQPASSPIVDHACVRRLSRRIDRYINRATRVGVGTMHHIVEEISNVITKHFFKIGDQMRLENCSFEDAYRAMAAHPGHRGIEWRGDMFETE